MKMTVADVVHAAAGRLVNGDGAAEVTGVSIDTRTLAAGDIFVAIKGERFDGHDFVEAALAAGASGVVVGQPMGRLTPEVMAGRALIVAPDTVRALQRIANWVCQKSNARVVAITGSAGKTTTKEVAAAFLELRYRVMRSSGNLNNHIGLPLSLIELRHGADVAVVELGMNHAGEIRRLVRIAEPDVRVWTNVAPVHLEFFASIDAIADAKAEILEGATENTVLVANADDARVMARTAAFPGEVVTFGTAGGSAVMALNVEDRGLDGMAARVRTEAGTVALQVPLLGRGNLLNVLAAIAVADRFDVPLNAIAKRAATLRAAAHRGDVMRLAGGVIVVDDAYNSNPRAVQGMLAVVAGERRAKRRVAVLGEMLELGEQSTALHEECGRQAAASGLSLLLTVGGDPARAMGRAAVGAGMPTAAVRHVESSVEAAEVAAAEVRSDDVVLVKGSRGIATERVVERLAGVWRG